MSALLLLYAMRRLSFDARLFSTELSQLIFNFSSFQVYEVVLIGTAILLARRKIWYDSTLLVFIENMFAFVPLMLVSQALLVENSVASILCLTGATLFVFRTGALTRSIHPLNFPPRLLIVAGVLLLVNVGAPVLTRHLHRELTSAKWDDIAMRLANVEWFVVAPALVVFALLLPRRSKESPAYFSRTEFPLLTLLIWIAGTAVHFYCINYVYALPRGELRFSLTIPTIWTACWVLWARAGDVKWSSERFVQFHERALLAASTVALLVPAMFDDRGILLTLGAMNVALFSVLSFKSRNWFNLLLLAVSGAATFSAVHVGAISSPVPSGEIHIGQTLLIAIGAFLLLRSVFSRDPRYGFLGGLIATAAVPLFHHRFETIFDFAQVGLTFVVLHSIGWNDKLDPHSKQARVLVVLAWLGNCFGWLACDGSTSFWGVFVSGVVVFIVGLVMRWICGYWAHRLIPFAALTAMVMPPGFKAAEMLMRAPVGLMILLASFLLFAIGIMTALTRSRWLAQAANRRAVPNL
ncbi:MAG: hypothetical protein ACXWC8_03535 [Limisphaerales bacterium]